MKNWLGIASLILLGVVMAAAWPAQSRDAKAPASDAELKSRIHAFLDRSLGWQGLDRVEVQSISAPDASGLRKVKVLLAKGEQSQEAQFLITADGREIIQGEAQPLSGDPWAGTRAKLDLNGAPSLGPANAPVTIVEFSDLECPYCKEEAGALDQLIQNDPGKVRLVFKYYPLVKIHPWSMQAAEAAACVTEQHPQQFWNFEKAVFDAQGSIDPSNAAQRLRDFATESGADGTKYDACLKNPATPRAVEASIANGDKVGVASTPTLFINGRMIPGAVQAQQLKMLVDHEAGFVHQEAGLNSGSPSGEQCGSCAPLPPLPASAKH